MPDNKIRVAILEGPYASLCNLGMPLTVCLQLQQSGVKLAEALWTAQSSGSGFSVSLYWPTDNWSPS